MEKKTIGKFIAALRKANGMTQKELGDKLFVSDKTVSRWECDECTPELSLIPSIAEIFGITTDELLRGERNNPDREATATEDVASKQRAKSDKQFKLMLDRKNRKYKNLTFLSVGITIFGLLAAMIANLGFSKGLIAFCLAAAFCVASEICQICFTVNARILPDEDDDTYAERIQEANTSVIKTATAVSFINLLAFAFCLPLVILIDGVNFGMQFAYWLGYGLIFAAVAFAVGYVIYALFVRKLLIERGLTVVADEQKEKYEKNKKLLTKTVSISVAIALALVIALAVWETVGWDVSLKERTFDNCEDFKAFMEAEWDTWYEEGYGYIWDENGDAVIRVPIQPDGEVVVSPPADEEYDDDYYPKKVCGKIYNSKGEVICEYYYNPDLYEDIRFTESADDKMPVTVITNQSHYDARATFQTVESILYTLIVIDFIVAAGIYLIKARKNSKKA